MATRMNLQMTRTRVFVATVILAVCLAAAACSGNATAGTATPTNHPSGSVASTPGTASEAAAPFHLTVTTPQTETVTHSATVQVGGSTVSDAVVTVNGNWVQVAADGSFSNELTLAEGPNRIDVVASDMSGHETSTELIVTYIPQP